VGKIPLLSIIITGYTTERLNDIYELLDSICAQTYPNFEVIFVVEQSQELLQKVQQYVLRTGMSRTRILFNCGESGLSAGRNVGVKEAAGEIIGFVDDDAVLFSDWAAETMRVFEDESIIGITGPALPLWDDESMNWFPEEFYWIISCTAWDSENRVKEVRNACGMNMSFRREAFEKAGLFSHEHGFHKGIMAEDNEFSLRVKEKTSKKIMYVPSVKLKHRIHRYRLTTEFIKKRTCWIGYSRRMMKITTKNSQAGLLLSQEQKLLRRILFHLFPRVVIKMFTQPDVSWKLLRLCVLSLNSVARGYYAKSAFTD
jgi:glucosyl-dolichyl phosphate glucuronosyltransferase